MKGKILIVEDNELQSKLLNDIFTAEGYETFIAADGMQALDLLKNHKVDLITSDVNMPRMDGFTLALTVKSKEGLKHIPFILYSSRHPPEDTELELAARYGVDRYVHKAGTQGIREEVLNFLKEA